DALPARRAGQDPEEVVGIARLPRARPRDRRAAGGGGRQGRERGETGARAAAEEEGVSAATALFASLLAYQLIDLLFAALLIATAGVVARRLPRRWFDAVTRHFPRAFGTPFRRL